MSTVLESPAATPPAAAGGMTRWLALVLVIVLFAGALFGYDQGVISGALPGIESAFKLSLLMVQVVTSWVTLGALLGSLLGGELADRFGRKRTVLVAGALFTLGAAMQYAAPDAALLVIGRLVIGAGVGVAAVAAPLYAAELAPARLRGRFVSGYQMAITIGIFLAYLVNGRLAAETDWRLMLGAAAVPGIALFGVALFAPESPRWLMLRNRRADAARELGRIEPAAAVEPRLDAIAATLKQDAKAAGWSELFHAEWRKPLLVALGLALLQKITGINAIIYYANQIFAAAGFATESARAGVTLWAVGGVNVVATLIAVAFIDKIGRRKLLLAGLIGMGASLAVVGVAFRFIAPAVAAGAAAPAAAASSAAASSAASALAAAPRTAGIVTVAALVVFIACFAFSLGPVTWTVINEVFPARIRSRGVALATAANWGSAWLVSQFFLSLTTAIGSSLTFGLLAGFCVVGWLWVQRSVPETQGLSLEDVQDLWKAKA